MNFIENAQSVENIPSVLAWGTVILTMVSSIGIAGYKSYIGLKSANYQFDNLEQRYKDNFSKEELLKFWEENQRLSFQLIGQRKHRSDNISEKLEDQIIRYSTAEVKESLNKGALIGWENPIDQLSPTYELAKRIEQNVKNEAHVL